MENEIRENRENIECNQTVPINDVDKYDKSSQDCEACCNETVPIDVYTEFDQEIIEDTTDIDPVDEDSATYLDNTIGDLELGQLLTLYHKEWFSVKDSFDFTYVKLFWKNIFPLIW